MTYIFRPGGYNVTAAETATITPQFGGVALPWWNPDGATPAAVCGAWQAKGAASLAASYLNLATLGNANIDPAVVGGVAPGWAAGTGWTFNGLTQYLKTGVIPANTQTWSVLIQFTGVIGGSGAWICGASNAMAAYFGIHPINGGTVAYLAGSFIVVAPPLAAGNLCISGNLAYRDGLPDGGAIGAAAGVFPEMYIGAVNWGGGPLGYRSGNIVAFAIYNVTLTAPQVLTRATAMAAL